MTAQAAPLSTSANHEKVDQSGDISPVVETPAKMSDALKEFEKIVKNHTVAFDKYIQEQKDRVC